MNPFPACKITVLKTLYHQGLVEEYRRPDIRKGPCPFFKVGDTRQESLFAGYWKPRICGMLPL